MSKTKKSLEKRIVTSANVALENHKYVSPIDLLIELGLLNQGQVQYWENYFPNLWEILLNFRFSVEIETGAVEGRFPKRALSAI